jgi:hypothetical protein
MAQGNISLSTTHTEPPQEVGYYASQSDPNLQKIARLSLSPPISRAPGTNHWVTISNTVLPKAPWGYPRVCGQTLDTEAKHSPWAESDLVLEGDGHWANFDQWHPYLARLQCTQQQYKKSGHATNPQAGPGIFESIISKSTQRLGACGGQISLGSTRRRKSLHGATDQSPHKVVSSWAGVGSRTPARGGVNRRFWLKSKTLGKFNQYNKRNKFSSDNK